MSKLRLSICIATYKRGAFIGETLDCLLPQLSPEVEVLVLDGASPDETQSVVEARMAACPFIRYVREPTNSGVDQDYSKAVSVARGEYCWLMTDDDLLRPDAVARVLAVLDGVVDLVVVNAEVRTIDFGRVLQDRLLDVAADRDYGPGDHVAFFEQVAAHLKFIGAVVVRRDAWLAREAEPYYGTLFVHVGVIFQSPPMSRMRVIADPLIIIRYGNAMWTPRAFEIWMFKWPNLIWSFADYSEASKARVSAREPWRQLSKLGAHRGLGAYSMEEYRRLRTIEGSAKGLLFPWLIACLPVRVANGLAGLVCLTMPRKYRLNLYELSRGSRASIVSKLVARLTGL